MSHKANYFLKKTLGGDFMESLQKFELWKPGTKTVIDHEEIKTALQIVPRTLMSFLVYHLSGMNVGETKETQIPISESGVILKITKHERDVYSGEIIQENKLVVDFKYRSIPGVGLIIMSAFELYDQSKILNPPEDSKQISEDIESKVQHLIEERMAMNDLVNKVVDKKIMEREAVNSLLLSKLTEELKMTKEWANNLNNQYTKNNMNIKDATNQAKIDAHEDEYFRGMANGLEVANAVVHNREPDFVEPPQKERPLKAFIEGRKKPKEFSIQIAKGEVVTCPDCKKDIFDGNSIDTCICYGDTGKIFLKKTENGIKVSFSKNWDIENIEMLLEVLRRKRG